MSRAPCHLSTWRVGLFACDCAFLRLSFTLSQFTMQKGRMTSQAAAYFTDTLSNPADADGPEPASSAAVHSSSGADSHLSPIVSLPASSDEELLLQVSKGSKEALSILFQRHARQVLSVARRILRDDSEAEDLLQELFLFLFQKAELFDAKKASASSWIIQMTYCRAIDRRRYLGVRRHYDAQRFDEALQFATRGQISIDEVAGRMLLDRLREELSPEQLQTLELHFFEGCSFQEIAQKTGQTHGNVRHHYYRGLERLRSYVFPEKHA